LLKKLQRKGSNYYERNVVIKLENEAIILGIVFGIWSMDNLMKDSKKSHI
jgi:hypothetical protein